MPLVFSLPVTRMAFWSEEPILALKGSGVPAFLDASHGQPDVAFVDPLIRRRLGKLARAMIHCAERVAPPAGHRMIFASRHGDCAHTQELMGAVAEAAPLSPAHFSISVHNAAAGLWSLLKGNREPCSALAAGPDTFALGLLEAAMALQQAPEQAVLYVFGENELPPIHQPFVSDLPSRHALAFLLENNASQRLELSLDVERRDAQPCTQLSLAIMTALAEGRNTTWNGPRGAWSLHAS